MDEADKMMDSSNEIQMQSVLHLLPKQRRTGLFSATMPSQLKNFVRIGMRNPYFIDVKMERSSGDIFQVEGEAIGTGNDSTKIHAILPQTTATSQESITRISELPRGLKNYFHILDSQKDKIGALLRFIGSLKSKRLIIFFGTCASVNFHQECLKILFKNSGGPVHTVQKLHGKINQKKRTKIYNEFRNFSLGIDGNTDCAMLLTTDLAARGIDIPEVDWIVQFDPPQWSDQFVHRIGRTARAGREG